MSKLSKLVNNPNIFFADYIKKNKTKPVINSLVKYSSTLNRFVDQNATKKTVPVKKTDISIVKNSDIKSPSTEVASKSAVVNLKYHINFFKKHTVILHSGEGLNAGIAHLKLWIPSFVESDINFIVLVRDIALFNKIKEEYPWLHIAYAKRPIDLEDLLAKLPFITSVFYPSSTGNNIHLVRFSYLNHIFIGHGDSDKASSAHKALRLYDEVWTAGEAHIDRFKNADFNSNHIRFKKVGRPNSYKVIKECQCHWSERNNKILYLPTWEGFMEEANYSSIHISTQIIDLVSGKLITDISAKYHPLTGNRAIAYKDIEIQLNSSFPEQIDNISIIDKSIPLDNIISQHNIFICDMSAVISECLAANGPIFVYIPKDKVLNIAVSNMKYEDYCYAFSDLEELERLLSEVLSGNDYLEENRKKAINYLVGYEETLNKIFIKELKAANNSQNSNLPSRIFDF